VKLLFFEDSIQGNRQEQQDDQTNIRLKGGFHLCVLSDGMGGVAGGKTASKIICTAFRKYFSELHTISDPENQLYRALIEANRQIYETTRRNIELTGMGATLIAVLIHEESGRFSFISVGDSPLYQYRNGLLLRINDNHAYYEDLKKKIAQGLLSQEEADADPCRHSVTSVVAGEDIPFVDRKNGLLEPGELLLMASDGLQTLNDGPTGEIADIIAAAGGEPEKAVCGLLQAVKNAGNPDQDNAAVIMLGLECEHFSLQAVTARSIVLLMLLVFSPLPAAADREPGIPALHTESKAVHRVLTGIPLSADIANALNQQFPQLREKGWFSGRLPEKAKTFFVFKDRSTFYQLGATGSAYLVSPDGYWVTNEHVVTDSRPDATFFLLKKLSPQLDIAPIQVVWKNATKDLAVFKAEPPQGLHPLQFAYSQGILPAVHVISFGFPGLADHLSGSDSFTDEVGYMSVKIANGMLSNQFTHNGTKMWQHNADIALGSSGGPLVNECAQVVGTNSIGIMPNGAPTGYNGAVGITELLPELQRLNVNYTQAAEACSPRAASAAAATLPVAWLYALAASVGILAAGFAAFLLYVKRLLLHGRPLPAAINGPRGQTVLKTLLRPGAGKSSKDNDGVVWKEDINGRMYRFDPVLGIVYKDDKTGGGKKQGENSSGKALRLRSAQVDDIVLEDGQSLVIGSAADKAQVVIPKRFVSRAHVKVTNQGGRLSAEDMGSTNGTFLNGLRLKTATAVKPGDVLSLTAEPGMLEFSLDGEHAPAGRVVWAGAVLPQFLGAKAVPLGLNRPITIGRSPDNTITVADSIISSHHCSLVAKNNGVYELRDAGSRNGTFIQGKPVRVDEVSLHKEDIFYLVKPIYAFKIIAG
jgi:serine/threonine protein phosphatase PrpC/pSer/pThr/pTyr-binding forkhead associated (FHA) protein